MCFERNLSKHFGILDLFEVTLSSHCPSLPKTTRPCATPPQSRIPKLYPDAFLRQNVFSFTLHPPPHIPTYSLSHISPREVFLLWRSPISASCLHHISTAHTGCSSHPAMVPSNSFVCLSPPRRVVLMADKDRSLQWLPQAGKSSQAQLYTSDQLQLSVERCLRDFVKYCDVGGAEEFYCLFGEVHLLPPFRQHLSIGNFWLFSGQVQSKRVKFSRKAKLAQGVIEIKIATKYKPS